MAFAARRGFAVHYVMAAIVLVLYAIAPAAAQVVPARSDSTAWQTQVRQDSLNGDDRRTRFVIGLDREAKYSFLTLPNRVVIELPDIRMQLPAPTASPVGLVTGFTGGLAGPGRSRVVIDVAQPVAIENARMERTGDKAWRLAFDMVPAEAATKPETKTRALPRPSALGAAGVEPPQPRPAVTRNAATSKTFRPTIVIDPGHGGHDSGAKKHGVVEKDVVLAFSLALRDKLRATGRYNVMMTRDTDVFVPLDDRREFAEKNGANLFIAVHADYASTQARGATIFALRDSMFNSLKRSAKSQVADVELPDQHQAVLRQVGDDAKAIASILGDLAQREVEHVDNSTSQFRTVAIQHMDTATTMRDNPEQSANFRVLLTAKVPSVLIELAFVSNAQDAKLLRSNEWREKVSDSIFTAIENYFANQLARLPM